MRPEAGAGPGRRQVWRAGEEAAWRLLRARGYQLLERNYRCRLGELDLVLRRGRELVFAEVKTRITSEYGSPAEAVTPAKRRRLGRLAAHYVAYRVGRECRWRLELVEVRMDAKGRVREVSVLPLDPAD